MRSGFKWAKIINKLPDLRQNPAFNCVMLLLLAIGVGLISLLLGVAGFGTALFFEYFSSPSVLLLNLLPPVLLIFFVFFLSGRAWIAFTLTAFLIFALSTVQYYKMQIHGDTFIFSDLFVAREVAAVLFDLTLATSRKIYLMIFAFICGILFSVFVLKFKPKKISSRLIAAAAVAIASVGLYSLVYLNTQIYRDVSVRIDGMEYSIARSQISRGFVYPFIHSIHQSMGVRLGFPEWYDAREGRMVAGEYVDVDIPPDRKVNIISIMLESYADFSKYEALDFMLDVYEPFHKLQEESVSGELISNIFAGWTIDTERLFLTGNTMYISYTKPTNSYVHYLRGQGYFAEGLHPGEGWFYDRLAINSYLGFDRFVFLEDSGHSSRDDAFFFPAVYDMFQTRDRSRPYFSFNISYQNHIAWNLAWEPGPPMIGQGGLTDNSFEILTEYFEGIYDTGRRLEVFIDSLRLDPDPLLVVVFGDHKPWLGEGASVYRELGIEIDRETEAGFYNRFTVPYFIWANDAAKAALDNDFVGYGGSFSPGFLMGEVFRLCSWEGPGHMQALREIKEFIDVVYPPLGIFRENGVLTNSLSPESETAFRRYRQMEIFRRENFER